MTVFNDMMDAPVFVSKDCVNGVVIGMDGWVGGGGGIGWVWCWLCGSLSIFCMGMDFVKKVGIVLREVDRF